MTIIDVFSVRQDYWVLHSYKKRPNHNFCGVSHVLGIRVLQTLYSRHTHTRHTEGADTASVSQARR